MLISECLFDCISFVKFLTNLRSLEEVMREERESERRWSRRGRGGKEMNKEEYELMKGRRRGRIGRREEREDK